MMLKGSETHAYHTTICEERRETMHAPTSSNAFDWSVYVLLHTLQRHCTVFSYTVYTFFQKWNLKSLFCPQKCKTFIEKYTYTHSESILSRQSFTRTAFSLVRRKKVQSTKGNRVSQQHHWKLWLLYVHLTAKPFLSFHVFLRNFQQSTIKRKILRLQRIDVTLSGIAYTCLEKYFDRNISPRNEYWKCLTRRWDAHV